MRKLVDREKGIETKEKKVLCMSCYRTSTVISRDVDRAIEGCGGWMAWVCPYCGFQVRVCLEDILVCEPLIDSGGGRYDRKL